MSTFRLVRTSRALGRDEWPLPTSRPSLIGRSDTSTGAAHIDLAADRRVSRRHAQIWFEDESWWIKDLHSRVGTSIGSRPLTPGAPTAIEPGAPIAIGSESFAVFAPEWRRFRQGPLVIDAVLCLRFGAALAAAGHPPVELVTARNWGDRPMPPTRLALSLAGIGETSVRLPRLAADQSVSIAKPLFHLRSHALAAVSETRRAEWCVQLDGQPIDVGGVGCTILAHDEWSYQHPHYGSLAAFVRPNHPLIVKAVREACSGTPLTAGAPAVLQKIFTYLSEAWLIDYRKDRAPSRTGIQKVRGPAEVLWDTRGRRGEGTCLDIALLIAGCLEAMRLQPLVALVDLGRSWHALAGCWPTRKQRLELILGDREKLLAAEWIDPNGCTRDPQQRTIFDTAVHRAGRDLRDRDLVFALDVAAARACAIDSLPESSGSRWLRS